MDKPIYDFGHLSNFELMKVKEAIKEVEHLAGAFVSDEMKLEIENEIERRGYFKITIALCWKEYNSKELFEKFEDDLADLLAKYGLSGNIEDGVTGNSTRFPREKDEE